MSSDTVAVEMTCQICGESRDVHSPEAAKRFAEGHEHGVKATA